MSYHDDYLKARKTLTLSSQTAAGFVAQLGALAPILIFPAATLGRRPGFQATVLDHKYWFAKLYELVTYEEITYSLHTNHPGFSLHFLPIFYGLYYDALQNFQKKATVGTLWQIHFSGPAAVKGMTVAPDCKDAIEFSVRTGAIAHIQGDMPVALATSYRSWDEKPKPAFDELKKDFIDNSEGAFKKAQARFYLDVNDKTFSPFSPEVGQFGAANYQKVFNIQPSLDQMFQWRRDAWLQAARSLGA